MVPNLIIGLQMVDLENPMRPKEHTLEKTLVDRTEVWKRESWFKSGEWDINKFSCIWHMKEHST